MSSQLFSNHNPASNSILPLSNSFFVGLSMCHASGKLGYSDYIDTVIFIPLNNHRIVVVLLSHLVPRVAL